MKEKINRKGFFKWTLYFLTIPLLFLINRMLKDQKLYGSQHLSYKLPNDIPFGLSISGPVIINKTDETFKIYSSKCTHLGCQISSIENNELVCPCHGSRYNADGKPVKGPSIKALKELSFKTDKISHEIIIDL